MNPILQVKGITKSFGGVKALDEVDLDLYDFELLGLIGPNGAGKSTLFEIIAGTLPPDCGHIYFKSNDITKLAPYKRSRLGIKRTFQKIELFQGMTILEHFLIAMRANKKKPLLVSDLLGLSKIKPFELERAKEIAEIVGLSSQQLKTSVGSLSLGHARLVELGRALAGDPELLLLDEPSSGLDTSETDRVAEVLTRINAQNKVAMILVEHDLELIKKVTKRIYVLDAGKVIASGKYDEVFSDLKVRQAYIGDLEGV